MPKFTVLLQQYVEKITSVDIEADTYERAIELAKNGGACCATWEDGDDSYEMKAYAVKQGDDLVWER